MGEAKRRRLAGLMPAVLQDVLPAVDAPVISREEWLNSPEPDYTVFDRLSPHCSAGRTYRDKTGATRYTCQHPGRAF